MEASEEPLDLELLDVLLEVLRMSTGCGSTPSWMRIRSTTGLRRVGMLEEAGEVLQALGERPGASCSNFPDWATRVTLGEVAEGTEGAEGAVVEASAAHPNPQVHELLETDLEIKEKEGDAVGAAGTFDELVEAALPLPVDGMFPEAAHPHPLAFVVVEGGVGVFREAVEIVEPHPLRHRRLSMLV